MDETASTPDDDIQRLAALSRQLERELAEAKADLSKAIANHAADLSARSATREHEAWIHRSGLLAGALSRLLKALREHPSLDIHSAVDNAKEILLAVTPLAAAPSQAEQLTPLNEVWCVANRTMSILFESQEMARDYVAQFGASVGGGMSITNMQVFRDSKVEQPSAREEDRRDLMTLCLRLCLEPVDSHSPDTQAVLDRHRVMWEAMAAGASFEDAARSSDRTGNK